MAPSCPSTAGGWRPPGALSGRASVVAPDRPEERTPWPPTSSTSPGHEQVAFCTDPDTGLRAIIALHDTSLGPGLGGTRFHPYSSTDHALADVLRLSRAMTSKNAVAGLDHGGGKAVIIGDPHRDKTPELLRAYGRFVESLGGRYVTACDVGTYVADMDVVGESTRWATGRSPERGGAGDSSVLTAYGVFQGMRAAAQHVWGEPTPAPAAGSPSRASARSAAGSPSTCSRTAPRWSSPTSTRMPCARCSSATPRSGRSTTSTDLVRRGRRRVQPQRAGRRARRPHRRGAAGPGRLRRRQQPARSPRASGGTADRLRARGITYAPDFLVNAGGVIQVSDELHGFDMDGPARARRRSSSTPSRCCAPPTPRTSPPPWPPTGSPSAGSPPVDRRPWLPGDPVGVRAG